MPPGLTAGIVLRADPQHTQDDSEQWPLVTATFLLWRTHLSGFTVLVRLTSLHGGQGGGAVLDMHSGGRLWP